MTHLRLRPRTDARLLAELHRQLANAYIALDQAKHVGVLDGRPLLRTDAYGEVRRTQGDVLQMLTGLDADFERVAGPQAPRSARDDPDFWHKWLDLKARSAAAEPAREGAAA